MRRTVAVVLAAVFASHAARADPIQLAAGKISGEMLEDGDGIRVYRGIPFAAPPVGALRWRPPQPVQPWDGVRPCPSFGPACPQPERAFASLLVAEAPQTISEDCLYLNVWTPARRSPRPRPVMVWIHGGGFDSGWGHQRDFDGAALARKGAVVVSINYRLGPLGFFAHPLLSAESDRHVSGNYGLLDQIAALTWVQTNIGAFGGDPDRVTLFGESAGGLSVNLLRVSPLARGLFQRAIVQSGPGGTSRGPELKAVERAGEALAEKLLGEGHVDLARLRAVTPAALVRGALPNVTIDELMKAPQSERSFRFGPAVDNWVLPADGRPSDKVPLIIGVNAEEGAYWTTHVSLETVAQYRAFVTWQRGGAAAAYLALYPADTDEAARRAFIDYFGDTTFVRGSHETARVTSGVGASVYFYVFTRKSLSHPNLAAHHAIEIAYVFNNLGRHRFDAIDRVVADTMSSMWVRFAATGDPNGPGLPHWPKYAAESEQHLEFGDSIRVGARYRHEQCAALDRLRNSHRAVNSGGD